MREKNTMTEPAYAEAMNQIAGRPYEVFHPDAEGPTPKFKTWPEARQAAKVWNREYPGHIARRCKI